MRQQPKLKDSSVQDSGTEAHDASNLAVELKVQIVLCCARGEASGPLRPDSMPILHPCMLKHSSNLRQRAECSLIKGPYYSQCQLHDRLPFHRHFEKVENKSLHLSIIFSLSRWISCEHCIV